MNDNLPDINFKEKKEKKKGIIGWLRGKFGAGSRGGAMGEAGLMNPSAMNVGRAIGAGKFGASGGLAGLLAGKAGILATIAAVAVASGVYLANQAPAPSGSNSAFSGGKVQDNYVPAILRSQAANQGSSLDMFKDTNKNAGLAMEEDPSKKNQGKPGEGDPAAAGEGEAQPEQPAAPDQNNMAQDMMGKLQGGDIGSLSSSLGGGSNKFSAMGGFGNKFNQGQVGAKTGLSSNIGSGFQGLPKFDARKGKMTAMKASSKPIFSKSGAGKKGKFGTGAFGQAKGLRSTQKSYTGNQIDPMAGTQNAAWTGSTPEGSTSGGTGLNDGGAGIMSSPSLDNSGSGGGGGGAGVPEEPAVPEAPAPTDVSPWASAVSMAMMMIMISCVLSAIGSYLISIGSKTAAAVSLGLFLYWAGMALCIVAAMLAAFAIYQAITIMTQHGQAMLGTVYLLGGAAAMAAAYFAMTGTTPGNPSGTAMVLAAAGGVLSMIGSMLGGK
ncbi:MAG: hypothetical protein NDI60_00485 [Elusimicrobiales bacterium]|nr:hypothetical protein [Elusimicrobiales bacterium]